MRSKSFLNNFKIKIFLTVFLIPSIAIISPFLNVDESRADYQPGKMIFVDDDNISGIEDGTETHPYNTIQEAVDAVENNENDTIFVNDGIYNENIDVNKNHLSILSKSGAEKTIVQAKNSEDNVFEIKADYVEINGFTIEGFSANGVDYFKSGIYLENANHCEISNNIASNSYFGIYLLSSNDNTLTNNVILDNHFNFFLSGNSDEHFDNDIDISNTVNGKPIYYLQNANNQTYGNSTNAGAFYCISCNNVTVKNLTLNKNGCGIFFWKTENSKIENIKTSDNMYAIRLRFSDNNALINNTVLDNMSGIGFYYSDNNISTDNIVLENMLGFSSSCSNSNIFNSNTISENGDGISFFNSEDNKVLHNNFINNNTQLNLMNSTDNLFDNGYPSGGNYWSDYNGEDLYKGTNQNQTGKDGIGDTSYEIEDSITSEKVYDRYPLIEESGWENPIDPYPSPEKYAPNLWFDSDENYYPIDPFFYVDDINKITGISSKLNYLALSDDDKKKNKFTVFYHIAETEDEKQWVYEYWFYYAYNDFRNEHYHDWETVFVFVDKETEEVERVVASAHGNWANNNEYFNPNFELEEHAGIMIEQGSHANCTDRNNDGLFQGSDVTNGPWPFAYGIFGRTINDQKHGYQIQSENYLPNLIEITDDFISKFKNYKSFPILNSPALGIFCFEVPIFGGYKCLSNIGGNPPEHPWINESYNNPEKIIPKFNNYINGTINPLFIPGMNNPTMGIILIMSEEPYPFTFTDENGEFLINNIEPGEHNIIVNLENYAPYKQRFIIEEDGNEEKEIIVGVDGILNLIPESESFRFEGTAKDEKGNLIINAVVDVYNENNQKLFTTLTDEKGQYLFNLSAKNNHTIEIIQEDKIGKIENISANPGKTVIQETIVSNPKSLKENALLELEEIKADNQIIDKQVNQIEKLIEESLDVSLWIDNWHLEEEQGLKVFQKELNAVKRIEMILKYSESKYRKNECEGLKSILPILNKVTDDLSQADFLLAETILQGTKEKIENLETNELDKKQKKSLKTIEKRIKKAENYLKQSEKQRLKKNYSKSVYYSQKSWVLSKQNKYLINLIEKNG